MTPPTPIVVAGIDVGKFGLDAHILPGSLQRHFNNDQPGRRALRNWLRKHGVTRAVFEPTGRYHRRLHQGLFEAGLETVLVNPLRSRRFAEALGQQAKNDRVDAAMLARFGLLECLVTTPPQEPNLRMLSDLLALRRKLVAQLGALRKLVSEVAPEVADGPAATLTALQADIAACGQRMLDCIATEPSWPGGPPLSSRCLAAAPSRPPASALRCPNSAASVVGKPLLCSAWHLSTAILDSGGAVAASGAVAPSRAVCSTWPPCLRSATNPPARLAISAWWPTASHTRWPSWPSCASSPACSLRYCARIAAGKPSSPPANWRQPHEHTAGCPPSELRQMARCARKLPFQNISARICA